MEYGSTYFQGECNEGFGELSQSWNKPACLPLSENFVGSPNTNHQSIINRLPQHSHELNLLEAILRQLVSSSYSYGFVTKEVGVPNEKQVG